MPPARSDDPDVIGVGERDLVALTVGVRRSRVPGPEAAGMEGPRIASTSTVSESRSRVDQRRDIGQVYTLNPKAGRKRL